MKFLQAALIIAVVFISGGSCFADDPSEDESTEPAVQEEVYTASGIVIDSEGIPVPEAMIACMTWANRKRKNILLKSGRLFPRANNSVHWRHN